jgi:hypothetical protein
MMETVVSWCKKIKKYRWWRFQRAVQSQPRGVRGVGHTK